LQRLSERDENFGGLNAFAIFDLLAIFCDYEFEWLMVV
jgi:hypothetical protein